MYFSDACDDPGRSSISISTTISSLIFSGTGSMKSDRRKFIWQELVLIRQELVLPTRTRSRWMGVLSQIAEDSSDKNSFSSDKNSFSSDGNKQCLPAGPIRLPAQKETLANPKNSSLPQDSDSSANRPLLCANRPHLRVNRVLLSASRVLLCENSKSVPQDSDSTANLSLLCAGLFCVRVCLFCEWIGFFCVRTGFFCVRIGSSSRHGLEGGPRASNCDYVHCDSLKDTTARNSWESV